MNFVVSNLLLDKFFNASKRLHKIGCKSKTHNLTELLNNVTAHAEMQAYGVS